jgi:hypothetical protein
VNPSHESRSPAANGVTSERWLAYYDEARRRRRAHGPRGRTSRAFRHWRRRERTLLAAGLGTICALVAIFYLVLVK